MSRVHVAFKLSSETDGRSNFDVISPDFSGSGVDDEVIGELVLDRSKTNFYFYPSMRFKKDFCPPEYFQEHLGDVERVENICKEKSLFYTAWSYRIYKMAKSYFEEKRKGDGGI